MSDTVKYKIDPSSATVARGDTVCLPAAAAGGQVVKANPAALASGGTVVGVAVSDPVRSPHSMDIVDVNVSGVVPNDIVHLGPGRAGAVYVDSSARCTRIATGMDYLVGSCDTQGNVKVGPIGALASHNVMGMLNVRSFGAVGDGVTDDLPAFNAAVAASTEDPHYFARSVWVPKGKYRLSGDLILDRTVELIGDGVAFSGQGGSQLLFDAGKGIINTVHCAIRELTITGEPVPGLLRPASQWQPHTRYEVGAVVRSLDDNRYYFECIRAGVSGAEEPSSWRRGQIPSYTTVWQLNKYYAPEPYGLGAVVRREGDFDRIFECVTRGTSGPVEPSWSLTAGTRHSEEPGDTPSITRDGPDLRWGTRNTIYDSANVYFTLDGEPDSGAIWEAKVHAGVHMRNRCEVSNCQISNFSNAGIHIQGSGWYAPPRNCSTWYLSRVGISTCGLGVAIIGDDTNAGYSEGLDISDVGQTWTHRLTADGRDAGVAGAIPGTGGVGIYDHSYLGCTHVGAHVEAATGAAYIADNINGRTVFLGCYSETATPNKITAPSIIVGGIHEAGFTEDSTGARFGSDMMRGIYDKDDTSPLKPSTQMLVSGGAEPVSAFLWTTLDESLDRKNPRNSFGWRYEYPTDNSGHPFLPGWWALCYGRPDLNNYIGISGAKSAEGPNWRDFRGHFRGHNPAYSCDYYFGCGINEDASHQVRGGHFFPGDRFELPGVPRPGGYVGKIVLVEGWRGRPWTPRTYCSVAIPEIGLSAYTVEPYIPNGYVYRCLRNGNTGETEPGAGTNPPWPIVIGDRVNDGDVIWECVGEVPKYGDYGLIVDRGSLTTTARRPPERDNYELDSYALADYATTQIDVTVTAFQQASPGPDGATFVLRGAWCRTGDTVNQVKPPTQMDVNRTATSGSWDARLELRGNTVVVVILGEDGKIIKWDSIREGT